MTKVIWNLTDWVNAIVELPECGPLPVRTVLVPNERTAHALRRELVRRGHQKALVGTRFVLVTVLAIELLRAAGVDFEPGEDALRTARLRSIFVERRVRLRQFDAERLAATPGWDAAFAHTIGELEAAGVSAEALVASDDPRLADIATVARAASADAGSSWSAAKVLREAAHFGSAHRGPVLAVVSGEETAAEAEFVKSLDATILLLGARPLRERSLERIERLYGRELADAAREASAPRAARSERDLLASYIFEVPGPRPHVDPDGTVELEEHAGIGSELDATCEWVGRMIVERGVPLEEIAVLAPSPDHVERLVERLAQLPNVALVVPGGRAVTSSTQGARALATLRAVENHLALLDLASLLPAFHLGAEGDHLTTGEARELASSLGTAGGNAAHPAGALEWAIRATARIDELAAELADTKARSETDPRAALAISGMERRLANLSAVRPALLALVAVAESVIHEAPLGEIWSALDAFLTNYLDQSGPHVELLLREALEPLLADTTCSNLAGRDALRAILATLEGLRTPIGRYGEPAVFVGTLQEALGLPFRAVRVVGLSEGALPSTPREDAVLSEPLRARVDEPALPKAADRPLAQLQALDRVIRDAREVVVLSAPRHDLARSDRECSSVFVEAAAALGRRDAGAQVIVPSSKQLARIGFAPARERARVFRSTTPLTRGALLDQIAARAVAAPAAWTAELEHLGALTAQDGFDLDGSLAEIVFPGTTPEQPISASKLGRLLECPRRFLYEAVLGFADPQERELRGFDALTFGSLLHESAERFFREHGAAFGAREGSLHDWQQRAEGVALGCLEQVLRSYPLTGESVRVQQSDRLLRDVRALVAYDWNGGKKRRFVDVERSFGFDEPVELQAGERTLFVRGFIDRLDIETKRLLIRDWKSGKSHPRRGHEEGPTPVLDVQLGLYGKVARALAPEWGTPTDVAVAYVYPANAEKERAFRTDYQALDAAADGWLATAAALLDEGAFPRTPEPADCRFCPFLAVCGKAKPQAQIALGQGSAVDAFIELRKNTA